MEQANFMWRDLGPIRAKTALDQVPAQSGLYKLTFQFWGNTYAYIGESSSRGLRARLRDYANAPTQSNKLEHLMHDLLKKAGKAELYVCCLGVDDQKARRQFEKEAISNAKRQGLICINKRGYSDDGAMQRFILESEAGMLAKDLERVQARLAKLDEVGSN